MILFAVFATLLVVVVVAFLLPPLWLGLKPTQASTDRQAANLAIFRDQLAELEKERAEGSLADADFEQAKRELQHRLLAEVTPEEAVAVPASHAASRPAALAVLALLPVAALALYAVLGNPRALRPEATAPRPQMTAAQIEGMVGKLAERLQANPDDMQGWLMLARSYKAMGRFAEAAEAYGKAEKVVLEDAELLADYAETLAMGGKTGMKGKPRELVDRALKLDPNNGHALLLAGGAAMEAGNRTEAIRHWEKLLTMVEPGSEIDTMLRGALEKLRQAKPAK